MEAGVDLSALAGRGAPGAAGAGAIPASAPAAEAGKLWTPGGESSAAGGGEKKVIWTPN
jgi:hypothetical protein